MRASEDLLRGLLIIPRGLRDHASERRQARPQSRTRPRGRDGAGRGPESAPGRQAAVKQVAPSFTRSGTLGASCRRPAAPSEPIFGKIQGAGAIYGPRATDFDKKWAWKARTDKRRWKSAVSADLNDARKRERSPSADRRRGWARGGLPRTASPRAPPPEARERARQNAAKNPADLHAGRFARRAQARVAAEGNARGGGERAHRERVPPAAAPAARTAAPCAGRAQPRQRRGRGRSGGGYPRAKRSGARVSVAARQRRAYGGKPRKGGQRSGGARGEGRARGETIAESISSFCPGCPTILMVKKTPVFAGVLRFPGMSQSLLSLPQAATMRQLPPRGTIWGDTFSVLI